MHFFLLPFLMFWLLPDFLDLFRNGRFKRSRSQYGNDDSYEETDPFFDAYNQEEPERFYKGATAHRSAAILQNKVFKLAKANGGRLTLSDAVIETNLPVKQAELFMNALVDGMHVTADVDEKGRMIYLFPELVDDA